MDRKRESRGLSTDRLSNLPCTIIGHILSLLPLKDAARTSVLSKKWKDKWLTIPRLVFEKDTSESVIYHVLLLHKEPIVKFAIEYVLIENRAALYHWFNFLSKHRIEELTIMLLQPYYMDDPYPMMPYHLFSFYNLKHLSLQDVLVRVPLSMYSGFSNLISIDFVDVIIAVEDLQRLIGKCPKLESLILIDCFKIKNSTLHISTPHNLKSVLLVDTVDSIYIFSYLHLGEVLIYYGITKLNAETGTILDNAIKFFGQLSKNLVVIFCFLKVLTTSVLPVLPKSLSHLKHIQFGNIGFGSVNNLKFALCLIRSFPNLQSIVIHIVSYHLYPGYEDQDAAIEYLKEEQESAVPLSSSLKEVKFNSFAGLEPEMEFVKLLFLGALELRKVEITGIRNEEQFSMRETLESFRRSSSQEIILKGDIYGRAYYQLSQNQIGKIDICAKALSYFGHAALT